MQSDMLLLHTYNPDMETFPEFSEYFIENFLGIQHIDQNFVYVIMSWNCSEDSYLKELPSHTNGCSSPVIL